eukprot:Tbor_TRINITY_DN5233_c2_g6::TRINITY_DN5233_c2_g6_i1::g.16761::m.16761/K12883/NCBP2, CBP20; nuclear cap-binding protein subunit 2
MPNRLIDATPRMEYIDRKVLTRSGLTEENFKLSRQLQLNLTSTIYIGNLSFYTTEEEINEIFSKIAPIRRIIMILNSENKRPCGSCFIEYYCQKGAARAVSALHLIKIDDREISVKWDIGLIDAISGDVDNMVVKRRRVDLNNNNN